MQREIVAGIALALILSCTPAAAAGCDAGSTAEQAQANMERQQSDTDIGGQIGGILGGLLGANLARPTHGALNSYNVGHLGSTVGARAGFLAAGPVTAGLDACDREYVTQSTERTLDTGKPSQWNGDTGASGSNRVVATDPAVLDANPGKICKTVEQRITQPDGSAGMQRTTACKGDDGVWQPAAS